MHFLAYYGDYEATVVEACPTTLPELSPVDLLDKVNRVVHWGKGTQF